MRFGLDYFLATRGFSFVHTWQRDDVEYDQSKWFGSVMQLFFIGDALCFTTALCVCPRHTMGGEAPA